MDLNNFEAMLSHGLPSYTSYDKLVESKYTTIEKKIVILQELEENIMYEQWNFETKTGLFINRQFSKISLIK